MKNKLIAYGRQSIDQEDIQAVIKVLKSDFLTTGPVVAEFEQKIAQYVGAKYAVAVVNATAALHLAVVALKIPSKSEGITTPITFLSSVNAMVYSRVKPIFADIKPDTYNIDPNQIEQKINKNTKLIIPVHLAGQSCEMAKISRIAKKCHLSVIEDAAHAIGSKYKNGERVGSCRYSEMTVFSFHPVKTMTTGEGGMITTNSKKLYETLKLLRSHGMITDPRKMTQNPGPWYYEMKDLGFNYRLTDIQSALGMSQLKKLNKFVAQRKRIVKKYNSAFKKNSWLVTPFEKNSGSSAFHLYILQINFSAIGKTRVEVMRELMSGGVGSQVHYIPVHLQPFYQEKFGYKEGDYPVAEDYYSQCLSIPLFPSLSISQIDKIINAVLGLSNHD